MTNQSDIQTPIFSSYKGINEFSYCFSAKNESVKITSKIQANLKEFVKKALKHFDKYNIPKLKSRTSSQESLQRSSRVRRNPARWKNMFILQTV